MTGTTVKQKYSQLNSKTKNMADTTIKPINDGQLNNKTNKLQSTQQ